MYSACSKADARDRPEGKDLRVTYIVKIALNGSIPIAMVNMVALETPMCVGRARDVYYKGEIKANKRNEPALMLFSVGHAPFVQQAEADETLKGIVFQTESFSDPGATPDDNGALEYRNILTTSKGASFKVTYDNKTMYVGGVDASCDDPSALTIEDDGKGELTVKCNEDGKTVTLLVKPKA